MVADGGIFQEREVEVTRSDHVGGIGEVAGAVAEAAFLQWAGTGGGEGGGFRVGVEGGAVPRDGLAKLLAQGMGDLTNMSYLFERGCNESGETFPGGLPDQAQAGRVSDGAGEGQVVLRKSGGDGLEVVIEREVMGDDGFAAGSDQQMGGFVLFQEYWHAVDEPDESVVIGLPVKDLTGTQCSGEVEAADGDGCRGEGRGGGVGRRGRHRRLPDEITQVFEFHGQIDITDHDIFRGVEDGGGEIEDGL